MKVYPLKQLTVDEAIQRQFRFVDCICQEFNGFDFLTRGDLGVKQPNNKPDFTLKAERVIAKYFHSEAAILLRGSGTNAIRMALMTQLKPKDKVLVHKAAIYPTTLTSLEMLGVEICYVDYNDTRALELALENNDYRVAIVQLTRQKANDKYDYQKIIKLIKSYNVFTITDDNYAAFKVDKIGVECQADASCFSTFKLLGPIGVGCCVCSQKVKDMIETYNYSGGSKVQGYEAMEVLRGMTYCGVALAISNSQINKTVERINKSNIVGIKDAYAVNAQSKVIIVNLSEPIAKQVIVNASKLGAIPHPVGSESIYEITPMFYRVSKTFLETDPTLIDYAVRINPMRSGADTIIRILKESIKMIKEV